MVTRPLNLLCVRKSQALLLLALAQLQTTASLYSPPNHRLARISISLLNAIHNRSKCPLSSHIIFQSGL
ncbi:hypothetical protein EW026_g271 [Hermanssonia centrifuga]|uniref:Secreted protein n=1 Tax=Hermanssonia centrifuga TaxID=98765 RepID=A0A4S4KV37_9APHY|nr:hypothetical protein EW026_g271 [Hermanssonia centrifuga]